MYRLGGGQGIGREEICSELYTNLVMLHMSSKSSLSTKTRSISSIISELGSMGMQFSFLVSCFYVALTARRPIYAERFNFD